MSNNPFLEERLPVGVAMGSDYADEYSVEISTTAGLAEHRRIVQPFPCRHFTISYTMETEAYWEQILGLYHRAYGMYAGFRVRCLDDFSTNGQVDTPSAFDQVLDVIDQANGVYQLRKEYGAGASPIVLGLPSRTLFKPVSGTVKIAVGVAQLLTGWTVDTTTGRVTFAADNTRAITGITNAASAVIAVGSHTYSIGQTVHISGVLGMTQINGQRAAITATGGTTITVAINSGAYGSYSSGGVVHTIPQDDETVYGGCEFDIPCRFNSRVGATIAAVAVTDSGQIDLIELISP